jgi:hypothetical protein
MFHIFSMTWCINAGSSAFMASCKSLQVWNKQVFLFKSSITGRVEEFHQCDEVLDVMWPAYCRMIEMIKESLDSIASPTQRFEILITMSNKDCFGFECIAM